MSDVDDLTGLVGLRVPDAPLTDLVAAFGIGMCGALIVIAIAGFLWASGRRAALTEPEPDHSALPAVRQVILLAERLRARTEAEAPGGAPWPERAVAALGLPHGVAAQLGPRLYTPRRPEDDAVLAEQLAETLSR